MGQRHDAALDHGDLEGLSAQFTEAYTANRAAFERHLRWVGLGQHAADDVVAEAMARVWRRLQTGIVPEDLGAYMRRAVQNSCADHWRKARQQRELLCGDNPVEIQRTPSAEDQWVDVERFQRALARLPRHQRQILALAVQAKGLSAIAEEMDLSSANAAGVALHRARHALRHQLLAGDRAPSARPGRIGTRHPRRVHSG